MRQMFTGAVSFNIDLSPWIVSNVVDMREMFSGATSFDQELCWDLSRHENDDFTYEFDHLRYGYAYGYSNPVDDNAEDMFLNTAGSVNPSCLLCGAGGYRTGTGSCGLCPAAPEPLAGSTGAVAGLLRSSYFKLRPAKLAAMSSAPRVPSPRRISGCTPCATGTFSFAASASCGYTACPWQLPKRRGRVHFL